MTHKQDQSLPQVLDMWNHSDRISPRVRRYLFILPKAESFLPGVLDPVIATSLCSSSLLQKFSPELSPYLANLLCQRSATVMPPCTKRKSQLGYSAGGRQKKIRKLGGGGGPNLLFGIFLKHQNSFGGEIIVFFKKKIQTPPPPPHERLA